MRLSQGSVSSAANTVVPLRDGHPTFLLPYPPPVLLKVLPEA